LYGTARTTYTRQTAYRYKDPGTRVCLGGVSGVCNKKKLWLRVMLRRRANALGNSQGQVTWLWEASIHTSDYGVSH